MTDQEIRIFNMLNQYGSTKGFQLKSAPTIEPAEPATRLWKFTFTNGREDRIVPLFDEDIMRDALDSHLSEDTRRKIDRELV